MAERTPAEWLEALETRLHSRWAKWQVFDAYCEGDHVLTFATAKFREAFGGLFGALADNWCPIVVEASVERLRVQGFRFGDNQDADADAWRIWQANGLDADSNLVHTEAVKLGEAYWLVQPNGDTPKITAEHPSQVIVACSPGDRSNRLAALKKWVEDDGTVRANVYLPDRVVKYRANRDPVKIVDLSARNRWQTIGAESNPLGVVPVVPMPNNPSMLRGGRSDLDGGVISIQNAINKLLCDMLIGSEYQAYPQRVLMGVQLPKYPPDHEKAGQTIPQAELKSSQSRLWVFGNENAKVAEFTAADLENFGKAIDRLARDLTAQTRTPPHYVAGQIVNASGDALKAAETGLVSKVRDKMSHFGEGHEEAMRLAFLSIDGDDERAQTTDAETIWADPESRSQAEVVDAAVKKQALGVPWEQIMEDIGYSPQQIDRMAAQRETDALLAAMNTPPPVNGAGALPVPPPN